MDWPPLPRNPPPPRRYGLREWGVRGRDAWGCGGGASGDHQPHPPSRGPGAALFRELALQGQGAPGPEGPGGGGGALQTAVLSREASASWHMPHPPAFSDHCAEWCHDVPMLTSLLRAPPPPPPEPHQRIPGPLARRQGVPMLPVLWFLPSRRPLSVNSLCGMMVQGPQHGDRTRAHRCATTVLALSGGSKSCTSGGGGDTPPPSGLQIFWGNVWGEEVLSPNNHQLPYCVGQWEFCHGKKAAAVVMAWCPHHRSPFPCPTLRQNQFFFCVMC